MEYFYRLLQGLFCIASSRAHQPSDISYAIHTCGMKHVCFMRMDYYIHSSTDYVFLEMEQRSTREDYQKLLSNEVSKKKTQ